MLTLKGSQNAYKSITEFYIKSILLYETVLKNWVLILFLNAIMVWFINKLFLIVFQIKLKIVYEFESQ